MYFLVALLAENRVEKLSFGRQIVIAITHTMLPTTDIFRTLLSADSVTSNPITYSNWSSSFRPTGPGPISLVL